MNGQPKAADMPRLLPQTLAELIAKIAKDRESGQFAIEFTAQHGTVLPDSVKTRDVKSPFKG